MLNNYDPTGNNLGSLYLLGLSKDLHNRSQSRIYPSELRADLLWHRKHKAAEDQTNWNIFSG